MIRREQSHESVDVRTYCTARGTVGEIVLQRQGALNAHDTDMNIAIIRALNYLDTIVDLCCVVLLSAQDKAFCAGGDIKALREFSLQGCRDKIQLFFSTEYHCDWRLASFRVPVMSIVDGIAFGGGAGFAIHPRYTIVTERAVFAMPETAIGLYPDAGASYFLQSLPYNAGIFLELTGTRINASDALSLGLAQGFVPRHALASELERVYSTGEFQSLLSVTQWTSDNVPVPHLDYEHVQQITSFQNLDKTIEAISQSSWKDSLVKASSSSLRVAWYIYHHNQGKQLEECLARELQVSSFMVGDRTDFVEGVRAAVVDKDKNPVFGEAVTPEILDELFAQPVHSQSITEFHPDKR